MYTIVLKQNAKKELDKFDKVLKRRMGLALNSLRENPFQGKALEGKYKGLRSVRVWPYRIIYEIKKHELIIFVIDISHRKDVYR